MFRVKGNMLTRRIALWTAFLALAAGIAIALRPRDGFATFSRSHPFSMLAPLAPPGWEVRDTPLGATELSSGEAARTLYFNDYFYKTYRRGEVAVGVYAAYWAPGRLDPVRVDGHTPDACWVAAGGTVTERDDSWVLPKFGDRTFWPGRFRVFEFPFGREEVVFWHCFGGKPQRIADEKISGLFYWLRHFSQNLRATAFGLEPREQIFVRISTNRTFDELARSNLWPAITSSLLPSGIFEPAD